LAQESYHIKVEYNGTDTLTYYLDGVALITKKVSDISSSVTSLQAGYVGVLSHFGKPTFNNVYLYTNGTDVSVNAFDTITVKENSALDVVIAKLPRTAIVTQSDGVKRLEKITWNTDALSTEAPNEFVLSGTVTGSTLTASIKIIVDGADQAMIGDVTYATLEQALAAVKEKDTIKLLTNVKANRIIVDPEVTLDLNGNVLTADYVVGFATSAVIDSSDDNSGKLIVPKDKVVLDKNNGGYLPVYNKTDEESGYYTFSTVKLENRAAMLDDNVYGFSPIFNSTVHAALAEGKANSGVRIVVRLSWEKAGNYEAYQDYIYLDEMVEKVMNGYNTTKPNNYADMFVAEFTGTEIEGAEGVTVSAVIISDTGVEIQSAVTEF